MVECKVCGRKMTMINNTHLKSHGMTIDEYIALHGNNLVSEEYRRRRSEENSGQNNPNFGNKWTDEQREHLSKLKEGSTPWNKGLTLGSSEARVRAIQQREAKYNTGELMRHKHAHSDLTRAKISESIKKYASENKAELQQRAIKGAETRRKTSLIRPAKKRKPCSDQTRAKLRAALVRRNAEKTATAQAKHRAHAAFQQLEIVKSTETGYVVVCTKCNSEFTRTRQYFSENKWPRLLCRTCQPINTRDSQIERDIKEYIESLNVGPVQYNDRVALNNRSEIDVYFPDIKLGFEINGLYWHSESVLSSLSLNIKKDHAKYLQARASGITLITIYEDEWLNSKDIVKSRLAGLLGKNKCIGARKTRVCEITSKEANHFLRENHLQSSGRSNVRLGLKYCNELIAVMTFSKENISRKTDCWEINRFCNKLGHTIIGGASKLFSYFCSNWKPPQVISYSDNRWGNGELYKKLGMDFVYTTTPNYWYFKPNELVRYHRYSLRKTKSDDQNLTEWQNRQLQGWNRIWDCGHSKWIWKLK